METPPTVAQRNAREDIVIIGAGIIGICAAACLVQAGRKVTVIDRTGVCDGTSSGNAGALAFSDVLPMAHKGMMQNLPRWLADPLGPLTIPPSYLPQLMPWLWQFWRAGSSSRYEASLAAQAAMMSHCQSEWSNLFEQTGTGAMLHEDGALELYESAAELRASLPSWAARSRYGIEHRHVEGDELAALQPGLSPRFNKGTYVPGWKTVDDPQLLGKAIWAYAQRRGAAFLKGDVSRVDASSAGALVRCVDGTHLSASHVLIAAGAWSHMLARGLGDTIPLETERGYNTTLPVDAFDVKRQLTFPGHGFVVTPLSTGLRIGGAVELGGLKLPPNFDRSKAMLKKAQMFLPGLKTGGGHEWMGYRPSLPDSLPVIGMSRTSHSVLYAFGHGHLGLTQAAGTARIVLDLIEGRRPAIDLKPFDPRRF